MKKILLASALAAATVSAAIAPTEAATVVMGGSHMHVRHHCRTELVTHWRHHRKVVEKVRICR